MSINVSSLLDLTSLTQTETTADIEQLCHQARHAQVASVCIYPTYVKLAREFLEDTTIKVCAVANFPHGTLPLSSVRETMMASIAQGADEIDVVFPYQSYLQGERSGALHFLKECKASCGEKILKVILESGSIDDADSLSTMATDVIQAGADFLKTSTGKVGQGATLAAARVMLTAIKNMNPQVGFKASGGIRTQEAALAYVRLAAEILPERVVSTENFRLGVSKLL